MFRLLLGFVVGVVVARESEPLGSASGGALLLVVVLGVVCAYLFGGRDRATAVAVAVARADAKAAAIAAAQGGSAAAQIVLNVGAEQAARLLDVAAGHDQLAVASEGQGVERGEARSEAAPSPLPLTSSTRSSSTSASHEQDTAAVPWWQHEPSSVRSVPS